MKRFIVGLCACALMFDMPAAWACLERGYTGTFNAQNLGNLTPGQQVVIMFGVTTTTYTFPGQVPSASVVSGPVQVVSATLDEPLDGTPKPATLTVVVQVTGNMPGPVSGEISLSNFCPPFPGNFSDEFDFSGQLFSAGVPVTYAENTNTNLAGDPISMASGELVEPQPVRDLDLGGPLPVELLRYYASFLDANGVAGALGRNWRHNYEASLSVSGDTATVTQFTGARVEFTDAGGGVWQLSGIERLPYQLQTVDGDFVFLDPLDGLLRTFDSSGDLTAISDQSGNILTVTPGPDGPTLVADGLGRTLTFSYTNGLLSSVQDNAGRSVVFEQTDGNLASFTDANGQAWTYDYAAAGGHQGLLSATTAPLGNQPSVQTFDEFGRADSQADDTGNTLAVTFDEANFGADITEPLGVAAQFEHDARFNPTEVIDALGGSTTFTSDANDRQIGETDRLGNASSATWDAASGRPASYTDAAGNTVSFTWTARMLDGFSYYDLTQVDYPDGSSQTFEYDEMGRQTARVDQTGGRWEATFNDQGLPLTMADPDGNTSTGTYNEDGTLATAANPAGDTTTFAYDAAFRVTTIGHPDGTTTTYQHDARGNQVAVTDENGGTATVSINANGRPEVFTDALGGTVTLSYDGNDYVTSATDQLGEARTLSFDALRRLSSDANPAGDRADYSYDTRNALTGVVDAEGNGITIERDAETRVTAIEDGLSRRLEISRDALGGVSSVTMPGAEVLSYGYDSLARLTTGTDGLGRTLSVQYDAAGRIVDVQRDGGVGMTLQRTTRGQVGTITDPNGGAWMRTYNGLGRLASLTDPLGNVGTYEYDRRTRLSRAVMPSGFVAMTYDGAGNLTRQDFSDGNSITYTYDGRNALTGGTGFTRSYDAAGRITNSNGLAVGRDDNGRIASVTYGPGRTVSYSYNTRGLLSQVQDWVGGATAFEYNAAGELVTINFANGVREAYAYDANGALAGITVTLGATVLWAAQLTRDAAGQIIAAERSTPRSPAEAGGDVTRQFDAAHQIDGFGYDSLGRVLDDGVRTYTWNLASRLTGYTGVGELASFTYDAIGQRTSATRGTVLTDYVVNHAFPLPVVSTVSENGSIVAYYVWLPDGTLLNSIAPDDSRAFYHLDETGSTVMLTDGAGAVTDTYSYGPYGVGVAQSGSSSNPFTWQGGRGVMQEGNGLYYMRARYYDAATQRFLSRDPLTNLDPLGFNPYQYALGNPLLNSDPSGLNDRLQRQPLLYDENDEFLYGRNFFRDRGDDSVRASLTRWVHGAEGYGVNPTYHPVGWALTGQRPTLGDDPQLDARRYTGIITPSLFAELSGSGRTPRATFTTGQRFQAGSITQEMLDYISYVQKPATEPVEVSPTTQPAFDPQYVGWDAFGFDQASTVPIDGAGAFAFFNPDNVEMVIRLLDSCAFQGGFNNSYWVFAAATTDVRFDLTVTDTQSGGQRFYGNPLGAAAPAITDTQAFASCP